MTSPKETAAAVFERINRRRADTARSFSGSDATGRVAPDGPDSGVTEPRPVRVRVDELLFDDPAALSPSRVDPPGAGEYRQGAAAAGDAADRFPRSTTMRLILRHPALALGLGVPAAGLLLTSPVSRRLLGVALRVGTDPTIQHLLKLSATAGQAPTATRPGPAETSR